MLLLAVVVALAWPDTAATTVRAVFAEATLAHTLLAGAVLATVGVVLTRASRLRGPRAAFARRLAGDAARAVDRAPWVESVGAIAAIAGLVWYALGRARVLPHLFADELIHAELARRVAEYGDFRTRGYGLTSAVVDALAYLVARDGAVAYHLIQALNVVVMALAAFPAYLLARRVVSHRRALVVSALTVFVPWMAYSSLVTTEAAFYPVFLLFVLALVRALERPTALRQLVLGAAVVLAYETRTQAIALVGAVVGAIVVHGWSCGRMRATLRSFAATALAYAVLGLVVAAAVVSGVWNPFGAYQVLLDAMASSFHPRGLLLWTATNVTSLSLGLGIVALLAFPLGVAALLSRRSRDGERAFAAASTAASLAILATVVALCESSYGTGTAGERNLFYVAPLVFIGALAWQERGCPLPRRLTVPVLMVGIGLAFIMPPGSIAAVVDDQTFALWTQLDESGFPPARQMQLAVVVAAILLLLVRRTAVLLLAAALSFVGVAAANDRPPTQPRSIAAAYTWVDRVLPPGAHAKILWVGFTSASECPAPPLTGELAKMEVYTEFFNRRIEPPVHLLADNPARGLGTATVAMTRAGVVVEDGEALRPGFVVADSRIPILGTRVASLSARAVLDGDPEAGALTLWRVDPPLRLRRPAQVASARERRSLGCAR
ncbi:MAG: glycosyltransferase family 39 protein [Thermoleophilia bacterium]|nr:glycosyltransferase family 39 protein [Thermoleophilia bacterium]